jgi:hypothetical protein
MRRMITKKGLAALAAVLAVGGGGAAIAASQGSSSSPNAFLDAVAKHLGISSDKLRDATKAAAVDQVNAALEEGRITKAQADELKARIEAGEFPPFFGSLPFGGFPGHSHGPGDHLSAAAGYLDLTLDDLLEKLENGRSLADVAKAEGKSVDGLKEAVLADAKEELDQAVADEDLTQADADAILRRLQARIDELVNVPFRVRRVEDRFGPGGHELRWRTWLGRPFA